MEMKKKIVIYVDIDDEGTIGIKTPVIGEEAAREAIDIAARKMPTDSDFNSMVVAYDTYLDLKSRGEDVEIAFLAGSSGKKVDAHIRLTSQLEEVLTKTGASEAIVVYDSPDDETALPIIQSRIKVSAIQRVIVEQYRSVEETYILLGKYLKKAISEYRYSRIFLGAPGVLLILVAILSILKLYAYVYPAILFILGSALVIRGLRIDERLEMWWENSTIMAISAILATISSVLGIIEVILSYSAIVKMETAAVAVSYSILVLLPYITFSVLVLLGAKAISKALNRDFKVFHDVLGIIVVIIIYAILFNILKTIEINQGFAIVSIQPLLNLIISTGILVSIYVVLTVIEKYKINPTSR